MRLIDADNYCENICRCNKEGCDKEKCPIHNAPTAYDVDKVIEQLEELENESNMLTAKCSANILAVSALRKAIEIVKAGGVK